MRRRIFWIFLFVLGSAFLGATVFREQVAQAIGSAGSAPVTETNVDSHGFIRVHEQGTVPVTGTVSISGSSNTVNLGSSDHDLLDSSNTHLANIDTQTSKLNFDSNGNLKTTGAAPPNATGSCWWRIDIGHAGNTGIGCNQLTATSLVVGGADDNVTVIFSGPSGEVRLFGSGEDGQEQWVVPIPEGFVVNHIGAICDNIVEDCKLFAEAVGRVG